MPCSLFDLITKYPKFANCTCTKISMTPGKVSPIVKINEILPKMCQKKSNKIVLGSRVQIWDCIFILLYVIFKLCHMHQLCIS